MADNLVEDDATLQMGIGAIPNAMLSSLANHKVYASTYITISLCCCCSCWWWWW